MAGDEHKSGCRFLYLAGPGNVIGTFEHWREGQDDPTQIALTYSGQFYELAKECKVESITISYHRPRRSLQDGAYRLQHRPVPLQAWRGPFFHLGWWWYHLSIIWIAFWHRCDALVIMSGSHLPPFWLAKLMGKKVILTEHCVLWPKTKRPSGMWRLVHWMDRSFFRYGPDAIMSMSVDITDQIETLTDGTHPPIRHFLPSYRRETFSEFQPAEHSQGAFRLLFAGRIEPEKGIFDLLSIAERLQGAQRTDIVFDIAGEGSALDELKQQIEERNLAALISVHGHCKREKMRELLESCHAVIVPTKSEMIEGFNKVVAEAVLSLRPFITSHLCPAIEYVRDAGLEVPPDDASAYYDAILKLADNRALYTEMVAACERLSEQFFDPERSWKEVLKRCLVEAE